MDPRLQEGIFEAVATLRINLKELFDYVKKSVYESETMLAEAKDTLINKYIKDGMTQEQAEEKYTEFFSSLDIEWNAWIDSEGNVHTENGNFSERELYSPNMYDFIPRIQLLFGAKNAVMNKISDAQSELDQLKQELEKDDLSLEDKKEIKGKIVLKKAELKKLKQSNNALNEKLDIATGKEDLQNEFAGMNAQQKMEFSQHREIYTNPADRRKDLSVFPEYIQRVVSIAENNKLKAKLMKALLASDPSLHAYLIDQMKASTGRTDTFAGLPYLNYSDDKILNVLKASPTIGGGLVGTVVGGPLAGIYGAWKGWRQGGWTEAQFKAFTSGYSSIVSSNLLHFRSSMMNNAQRHSA